MSNNPPHAPGPPRPSLNYSTPGAYSTAGLGGAPYGYPGSAGPTHDPFRAQNSLPSMRTFDPVQQQHQQQQHMAVAMPMTPVGSVPGQQPMSYYGQHVPMGGLAGNAYGGLPPEVLGPRYALPPNGPGAVLATGRHKKEIKRRTKTGCMTCRKRRIKCDEQHPVCKNCQKSKRECLGYDPIFKNQQQHPTNIQPAPNHASSPSPAISNGPQAPLASVSAGPSYAQLPAVGSNSASPANTSFNPVAISAAGGATHIKSEALEYPSIDPTLDGVLTTPSMSASYFPAMKPVAPTAVDPRVPDPPPPHLRGGGPCSVPSCPSTPHCLPSPYPHPTPAYSGSPAPRMRVHDLVAMGGAAPPPLRENVGKEKLDDVQELYVQVYAPGLQKFFESDWYTQSPGLTALASNMSVIETVAAFLQSVSKTDANDIASMQYAANLEFRVVWELAALVYISEYKINAGEHLPSPSDGSETRNRVLVFETLLSGDFLDQNLLQAPLSTLENPANPEYFRNREFKFWYWLAEFLRVRDQPTVDSTPQREHILAQMRDILDGRENRDVLYSIAVIRTLAPNFPPGSSAANLPDHLDESDPQSKLHVARKFIQDESQVNTGTTNVVRRFAELAVRAFIVPGSNVTRRQ
ncbi:hypothetical protein GGR56DRAFT_55175 [Xylariaceae sp. FL0804]|nr:hypothetical protein GGR56DRAFT_55175 [Xylariaceae sp. FL0804]